MNYFHWSALPPVMAPILGNLISATIGAAVTFMIAERYTQGLKSQDAYLSFVNRYQDLIDELEEIRAAPHDEIKARGFYRRFFILQMSEFDFVEAGLLGREKYASWAKWRWYDYRDPSFLVYGVRYAEGWRLWKLRPVTENHRFVKFLDKIHQTPPVKGTSPPNERVANRAILRLVKTIGRRGR